MVVVVLMDRGSAAAAGGCRACGGCAGADAGGGWRAMTLQVRQEREGWPAEFAPMLLAGHLAMTPRAASAADAKFALPRRTPAQGT
jgi:hypothetical protein